MAKIKMTEVREAWVKAANEVLGPVSIVTRKDILKVLEDWDIAFPYWQVQKNLKAARGEYYLPNMDGEFARDAASNVDHIDGIITALKKPAVEAAAQVMMAPSAIGVMDQQDSYVPEKFDGYVSWGNFNTVKDVVKSGIFYPMFITGLSVNGKTLMVKEVCAKLKR